MEIREDDLRGRETRELVEAHLADMRAITPPDSVHALGAEALRAPDLTLWSVWEGEALLGCGALKALGPDAGEIKAMRTAEAHRRRGVASRLIAHIEAEARRRGYRRLYLETGAPRDFAPGRALYASHGFAFRGPFGDYADDPHSVFMEKEL